LDDALLPAERKMVAMGEQQRVRDTRMFFHVATADEFIATVETITGRTVRAFASATDPDHGVVMENFIFEPEHNRDGRPD
jgi:Na+-translocating membrane potential-generating system MpsC-like protein